LMAHRTSTDTRVLLEGRVLFGVKVRRCYHASGRPFEIDGKKQR
jgi:hypothetical protein